MSSTPSADDEVPEAVVAEGLLVETHRAYLAWKGSLATANRARDAEQAARGAWLRIAQATAGHHAERVGHRVTPHDPAFQAAAEAAWHRHVGRLAEGALERRRDDLALEPCAHAHTTVTDGPSGETYREHCDDCGVLVSAGEHPQ